MSLNEQLYGEFMDSVANENRDIVDGLNNILVEAGCKIEIKPAKNGYLVSYLLNKKTVINYVFRKKGLIIRIYGDRASQNPTLLDTLPDDMLKDIDKAPICKRLVDPAACNPKCKMGYDITIKNNRYQKCRYNAFMFLISNKTEPYIKEILKYELEL